LETHSPDYAITTAGSVVDAEGASLTLSAKDKTKQFGTAIAHADATPAHMQRVVLSGELHTTGAVGGASLWLRIDHEKKMLILDNGTQNAIRGDADWTARSITLPVPSDATTVVFGVLLQPGGGSVEVRHLRLTVAPLSTAPIAPAAQKLLDEAISVVRKNALHAKDVDWAAREPEIHAVAAGAEQTSDVYPAIRYLLGLLGDGHSFFQPPAQAKAYATGGADNPKPEFRARDGVAYIAIPGYGGTDPTAARAYALYMFKALQETASSARCGWIIDLRTNSGGNMYPMLNGLEPFLGDGTLGFFVDASRNVPWRAPTTVSPAPILMPLRSAWVAVITGPHTASSGEIVAIAFRDRPNTRSFGQPTAGLSTANRGFKLSDGSNIVLTLSVDADRTGRVYGGKLDPDQAADDATVVDAATKWLRDSSACGAH
jgi:hypothetical protein